MTGATKLQKVSNLLFAEKSIKFKFCSSNQLTLTYHFIEEKIQGSYIHCYRNDENQQVEEGKKQWIFCEDPESNNCDQKAQDHCNGSEKTTGT